MAQDQNAVEQAVSRALRENLESIQGTSEELHHAISDVVAACSSNKPTHALPPLLRAQTAAASLAASLDVLTRFVAISLQPGPRSGMEAQLASLVSTAAIPAPPEPKRPEPVQPTPKAHAPAPAEIEAKRPQPVETKLELHPEPEPEPPVVHQSHAVEPEMEPEVEGDFDVNRLSSEEQELHRRANRVAKVSMQDIKMLRPEQVRLGREKKDLCIRLKDDIEKAHREYDRRFKPIMDHPVDYFYRWMVEILAEGDPHALGEYPYATPAQHR
jgi:hypothetical protein